MSTKLAKTVQSQLGALISTIPDYTDSLHEVRISLNEAIKMNKPDALKHLRIRLEPSVLVNDDIAQKKDVYRTILSVLNALGLPSRELPGISVVEVTIDCLFAASEYAAANKSAKELHKAHVKGRSSGTTSIYRAQTIYKGTQDARSSNDDYPMRNTLTERVGTSAKALSSATLTFRDNSHRFSGNYDCPISLHRFKQLVTATCDQFSVPPNNRVSLLTSALEGQALDFFLDCISGTAKSLEEAFRTLDERFDSPHARAQAQSYLESLTLEAIRNKEQCTTAQALDIAIKKISTVAPMCGPHFQHDSHKAHWLSNMLRSETWAQQVCTNRMTMAQDYRTFTAALHASLTQISIANMGSPSVRNGNESRIIPPRQNSTFSTFFGRRFAVPRNRRPFRQLNRIGRRSLEEIRGVKQNTRCLKCGEKGHWRAECPRRDLSMTNALNARIRAAGTHHVSAQDILTALIHDEDEYSEYLAHHDENGLGTETFIHEIPDKEAWQDNEIDAAPFESLLSTLDPFGVSDLNKNTTALPIIDENHNLDLTKNDTAHFINNEDHSKGQMTSDIHLSIIDNSKIAQNHHPLFFFQQPIEPPFLGGLIDTGAQKTVVGKPQALAYLREYGENPSIRSSNHRFKFGNQVVQSTHVMEIIIPTPQHPLRILANVVHLNIPLLIGLDTLRKHGLQPLTVYGELESTHVGWRLPLTLYRGHFYLQWFQRPVLPAYYQGVRNEPSIYYNIRDLLNPSPDEQATTQPQLKQSSAEQNCDTTAPFSKSELLRIHRNLGHSSSRKLYELLRRSYTNLPPNTLQQLEDIVKSCKICAEFAPRPVTFRVREADTTLFNHRLMLDLLWLQAKVPPHARATKPVLHIVDVGTRFNAAAFIPGDSALCVWNTFLKIWCCMYVGLPSSLLVDQGSIFISDEWRFACEINNIELVPTGTGSHNSLNAGESYHAYLRRTYNKVRTEFPKIPDEIVLSIATKAINDTTGPRGLCPTLLVFGVLPQIPTMSRRDHPNQIERFRAAVAARREYEKIVSDERIKIAASKRPPPAADAQFSPGDMVYVYREQPRKFTGPHMISTIVGKQARIHVGERTGPREFNIAQLRHSSLPNASVDNLKEPRYPPTILHTEIIAPGDSREALFTEAKKKELLGLLDRGAFRIVLREQTGVNPNIIPTRYVLTIKHNNNHTEPPRLKARFVLGGHRDQDKNVLLHDSTTVRPESIRLLIALGTIFGLTFSTIDWVQGYIQSESNLLRKVFVKPRELNLGPEELVQVIKPIYGLSDSGDYWGETLSNHLRDHLNFTKAATDLALWFRKVGRNLIALAATHVDDVLLAASPQALEEFSRASQERFDIKITTGDSFTYLGLEINTDDNGIKHIKQSRQINRLKILPHNASFESYRSARASLAWVQQSRPDIACAISFAARITQKNFNAKSVTAHNATVKYLKSTIDRTLKFPRLNADTIHLCTYIDAGHVRKNEPHSQLGYLVLIVDDTNRCAVLCYSSKKSKRIVRSTTSAEGLAFATGFDVTYAIREDLQRIIGRSIPIMMITDSEILFNIIVRNRTTTEKRMMIDLYAIREAYTKREIDNVILIASEFNPADALTKINANSSLRYVLDNAQLKHPIRQFVIESRLMHKTVNEPKARFRTS